MSSSVESVESVERVKSLLRFISQQVKGVERMFAVLSVFSLVLARGVRAKKGLAASLLRLFSTLHKATWHSLVLAVARILPQMLSLTMQVSTRHRELV